MISIHDLVNKMVHPLEMVYIQIQEKLRTGDGDKRHPGSFILHRNQWNGLAQTYASVVDQIRDDLRRILEPLLVSLRYVLWVMKAAENSFVECVAPDVRGYFTSTDTNDGNTAPTDPGYNYVWVPGFWTGPELTDIEEETLQLWMRKKALKHILDCEVVHRHMDNLRTTSMAVHQALLHLDTLNPKRFSERISIGDFSRETYAMDKGEARAFFSHQEIAKIDISQLLLQRLGDDMSDKNPDAAVERLAVDPTQFQKCDLRSRNLGMGSFGRVKLRKWISDDHQVAVKMGTLGPKEIVVQARVRHPNLLPLLCCIRKNEGDNEKSLPLVMEHMDTNLDKLIHDAYFDNLLIHDSLESSKWCEPFSLHVSLEIMLQIAKGMEYLHRNDIVHRDLKPANILVSGYSPKGLDSLRVKVADFGASKDNFKSFDRLNTYKHGTGFYRAPELVDEESNAGYSRKTDVYSFAMVCYRILSGKEPFEGDTRPLPERRELIRKGDLRPRFDFRCWRAIKGMVEACWHHDPSKRPDFTVIAEFLRFVKVCTLLLMTFTSHRPPQMGIFVDVLRRHELFQIFCDTGSNIDEMLLSWSSQIQLHFSKHSATKGCGSST